MNDIHLVVRKSVSTDVTGLSVELIKKSVKVPYDSVDKYTNDAMTGCM